MFTTQKQQPRWSRSDTSLANNITECHSFSPTLKSQQVPGTKKKTPKKHMTTGCKRGEIRWLEKVLVFQILISLNFRTNFVPLLGWKNWSKAEGWTWMVCLNKRNNGFYCRAGSNSPTHPWQGAALPVEQAVSKHKVDLADYNLERHSYWAVAPLSLSFSATLLGSQPCWMER